MHRKLAAIEFRALVREVLERRTRERIAAFEQTLASFASAHVRGDFVPTIADAYADALAIVNARGVTSAPRRAHVAAQKVEALSISQAPPLRVELRPLFHRDGSLHVQVLLVSVSA